MERHQRKRQRLLSENPADRTGFFRTPDRGAAVDRSRPLPVGEGAVHARPSRADTNLDPRLRPNRSLEIRALRRPVPLSARKGPQPAEQLPFRSPDEEDPPVRGYEPEDNGHRTRGPRPRRDRQLSFLAGRAGQAQPFNRTAHARRRDGRANRGTEFHQCLVEGTGRSGETSRAAISAIRLRTAPAVTFSRIRNKRATTRTTFPSTAGTGIPKAMLATAPAVYGPIPGSDASSSLERGTSPPCRWTID